MDHVISETDRTSSFTARYRDGSGAVPAQWNDVLDRLLSHRSVRAYLPDPVPPGTLEMIIAAAQSASTSSNLQAWSVVAVTDPDRKNRLADLAGRQQHIRDAPLFLVWLADLARLSEVARERDLPIEGVQYLEVMIVGIVDAALAAQNAVVALESLGLGANFIGGIRNHPEKVAAELGLPPRVFPVFGLTVGTPDPSRPAHIKPRLPQSVVLHHEQYDLEAQKAPIAAYDEHLRSFQIEENMAPEGWAGRSVKRVQTAKSLNGRDRMREALANLGLEIR